MRGTIVAMVLALFVITPAFADMDKAIQALKDKDYNTALPLLAKEHFAGNSYATVIMAQMALKGKDKEKGAQSAARFYEMVASRDPEKDKYVAHAQYNLGALYYSGRGVGKDIPKAMSYYEESAKNGFVQAQTTLVVSYYRGTGVKKDKVQALKWILIAAGHGDKKSLKVIGNAAAELTTKQIQVAKKQAADLFPDLSLPEIPKAPKLKHVVEKGLPKTPIAPSAGFTKEFQQLYHQPLSKNDEIIKDLEGRLLELTPPYIYELARRIFMTDKQQGLAYFWLARHRSAYDASRCTDRTAGQGIIQWTAIVRDIVGHIKKEPQKSRVAKMMALHLNKQFMDDPSPSWICFHGMKAITASLNNKKFENWLKPEAEWDALKKQNEERMIAAIKEVKRKPD